MSIDAISRADAVAQTKTTPTSSWTLEAAEYLLLLVIAVIAWTFGFIELLNRTSSNPTIFGLYSTRYFIILVTYSLGYLVLGGLLARPSKSGWLTKSVTFIQNRAWLASGVLGGATLLIWNLMTVEAFTDHPLAWMAELPFLRLTIVGLSALIICVMLFGGWGKNGQVPLWRKGIAAVLALLLVIEVIFQVLAFTGLMPGDQRIANVFVPYGRVYQNVEGFGNGTTNNFGWYYPDFKFTEGSKRILLLGDTYIQALQIDREQHVGVKLDALLQENQADQEIEVLAMGMPGFGPGLYLSHSRLEDTVRQFQPDEIILFFHLSNDFQTATTPTKDSIVYQVDAAGKTDVLPDGVDYLHSLKHLILHGYERRIDPLATIRGNYLTAQIVRGFWRTPESASPVDELDIPGYRAYVVDQIETETAFALITRTDLVRAPGQGNFMFEKAGNEQADNALAVAKGLLASTQSYLASEGVTLRIVTIPVFPKAFYTRNLAADWDANLGPYDLFLPERALQELAIEQEIPILAMGQYLQNEGLTVEQIKALYYADGLGHFTPQGHETVANAIYDCFFSGEIPHQIQTCIR